MAISFPLADVFPPAAKQLSVVSNQLSANTKAFKKANTLESFFALFFCCFFALVFPDI